MTQADRIRKLIAAGKSNAEIARLSGCATAYVRLIRHHNNNLYLYGSRLTPAQMIAHRDRGRRRRAAARKAAQSAAIGGSP